MPSRKFGLNLWSSQLPPFSVIWALYNRPVTTPDWPEQIACSFSPSRRAEPQRDTYWRCTDACGPGTAEHAQTGNIRTYSFDGPLKAISPAGWSACVTLGIWLAQTTRRNDGIAKTIEI
jgi:exo-beta-1,3-glucanase (GH17 family)